MTAISERKKTLLEHVTPRFVSRSIAQSKRASWQRFYERVRKDTSVVHVNDCADDDARTRLIARSSEIVGTYAGFIGVEDSLAGGAGIITTLDALDGASDPKSRKHKNVILANVAPREGEGKKHQNGSPFCYFWHGNTLVVTTVDGLALSLVKKFNIASEVRVLDTAKTLQILNQKGMITDDEEKRITETQFRSFEFSPRVASYLLRYGDIASAERKDIQEIPDAPQAIWQVDKFAKYGNCKTTILPAEVLSPEIVERLKSGNGNNSKEAVGTLATAFGILPVYRRLKDVPNGDLAVIVGSSGFGDKRLLEIVVQGGSAGKELGVSVGDAVFS